MKVEYAIIPAFLIIAATAGAQARVVSDLQYTAGIEYPNKKDRLDLYIPQNARAAPVVVFLHGGGLREGDKAEQAFVGHRFARAGIVTAIVNYRLSPAVAHPAHIEDVAQAFAWLKRNVRRYGGDSTKLVVVGYSAGAYLATLLALDLQYLRMVHLTPSDIRAVVPISGFFYVDRRGVAPDRPKDTWGTDSTTWRSASPAMYVRADLPPLLLIYADGDANWRRQQQVDFAAALHAAGDHAVDIRVIADRDHTSIWRRIADEQDDTFRTIEAFVRKVCSK